MILPVATSTSDGTAGEKPRNPWIWISAVLAVVAVGLLIWGLNVQSDRDDAQQQVKDQQAQLDQGKQATSAAGASYKQAYDDLEQELGTTSADLSQTEQDLADAQKAVDKAEQDAAAAKQQVEQAQTDKDKSDAEAEQAKADAQAAEAKNTIVTECANAYLTGLGSLLQSEDPTAQAKKAKQELQGIAADCKAALEAT
jgi:chromosome segregation ATPase